jgi:uncharacterized protein YrzB (UPF0473 family)
MDFEIEKEKIKINKNGQEIECDILFTFDCEDTMKSYVGYTDHSIASNGRKNIYVSSYSPLGLKQQLEDITDERELEMVNDVLQQIDQGNI